MGCQLETNMHVLEFAMGRDYRRTRTRSVYRLAVKSEHESSRHQFARPNTLVSGEDCQIRRRIVAAPHVQCIFYDARRLPPALSRALKELDCRF